MKTFKIGRGETCDVCLDDQTVSAVHAELVLTDSKKLFLNDCGSQHGTFVFRSKQWARVTQDFIHPDEWVRFGDLEVRGTDLLLHIRDRQNGGKQINTLTKGPGGPVISGPVRRNEFGEPTKEE